MKQREPNLVRSDLSGMVKKDGVTVEVSIVRLEDEPSDEDRTMATVHNEPPLRLQLLKAPRKREFPVRRVHEHTSRGHSELRLYVTKSFRWDTNSEPALGFTTASIHGSVSGGGTSVIKRAPR